jgi:hypothetical protein
LPTADAPGSSDGGKLFVTGYSQGGYVAMATHRAMQSGGMTVTASAPMSGPYALAAFGDAIFEGQVSDSATVNIALTIVAYQKAYQDFESSQIKAGVSLNDPNFYAPFFKDRPSIASPPALPIQASWMCRNPGCVTCPNSFAKNWKPEKKASSTSWSKWVRRATHAPKCYCVFACVPSAWRPSTTFSTA